MKKKFLTFISAFALCVALLIVSFAHSGRTDSSGGHYNRSDGSYHYHHGYSAHNHYDMDGDGDLDCPYTFDDKTNHSGSSSNGRTETTTKTDLQDLFNKTTEASKAETKKEPEKASRLVTEFILALIFSSLIGYSVSCLLVIGIGMIVEKRTGKEMDSVVTKILTTVFFICFASLHLYSLYHS